MPATTLQSPARSAVDGRWPRTDAFRRRCALAATGGGVLAIIGGLFHPAAFFHAYLFAALACLHPALGCLPLTFIHRLTGGAWGHALAPALAAGRRMVPWSLLFGLPLLLGLRHLFPWAAPDALDEQARVMLAKHSFYFSRWAFVLRAFGYVGLYLVLLAWARPEKARVPWTGPVGLILYVVTTYLLSVDWVLSLEPGWYSTGFPVVFMAGQTLTALAWGIAATVFLGTPSAPAAETERPTTWRDLGNLLLAALMFWAYVAYGQFLIVWSGNLPEQAAWYLHRNAGGWHYLLIALAVVQLLLPVLLLLSPRTKRRTDFFGALAVGVGACQAVYLYWLVLPSFRPAGIGFHWLDAVLPLTLDAAWLYLFLGGVPLPAPDHRKEDAADA